MWLPLALFACSGPDPRGAVDHLVRASIALRGVRPAPDEVLAVHDDPSALDRIVRGWLDDPRLGETVRDLHAEQLLVRIDSRAHPPPVGDLAGVPIGAIAASLDEEPLRLIEHVVTSGRPYTDIVTTDLALADPVVALAYGVPYDPEGPEWQASTWDDGRPAAGILSSTTLWQRHMSSDTNHHRTRGALVTAALLCDDLQARSAVSVVTPAQAEDAVREDPACTGCHAVLDPVSSAFWGFERYLLPSEIQQAHAAGCPPGQDAACYPLRMWNPDLVANRQQLGLPEPGLYGDPVDDLSALGRAIAADPRFPTCTARRFAGWMTRTPPADVDDAWARALGETLVASGWDARELMFAIATSPRLAPGPDAAPAVAIRPEQLARTVEALTGFRWSGDPDPPGCHPCYGPIGFATSDEYGFRTLLGGLDGWDVVQDQPRTGATRELAIRWLSEEAADFVVEADAVARPRDRRLLPEGPVDEEARVRETLASLFLAILSEVVDPGDPAIDPAFVLWSDARRRGDAKHAWKVVIAALLQDDRVVTP